MRSFTRNTVSVIATLLVLLLIPKELPAFPSFSDLVGRKVDVSTPAKGFWGNLVTVPKINPSLFIQVGLQADTTNRDMQNQTRRILITAGDLKPRVEVTPNQFFEKYSKDFGLQLKGFDVAKKAFVKPGDPEKNLNAMYFYDQYVRNAAGNLIPVMGSRAGLEVDENSRVVSFFHSFVPDLSNYLGELTPKISYDEVLKLVATPNQVKKLEVGEQAFKGDSSTLSTVAKSLEPSSFQAAPSVAEPVQLKRSLPAETVENPGVENIQEQAPQKISADLSVFRKVLDPSVDQVPEEVPSDPGEAVKFRKGTLSNLNDSLNEIRATPQLSNEESVKFTPSDVAPWKVAGEKWVGPQVEEHLVIFFKGNRQSHNARLAYKVVAGDEENPWFFYVDAINGDVLSSEDALVYSDTGAAVYKNVFGTGVPYPYYGNTGKAIPLITKEDEKNGYFILGCDYISDISVKERCSKNIVLGSRVGKKPGEEAAQVFDNNNIFAENDTNESIHRVDVSVMKGLQLAIAFIDSFGIYNKEDSYTEALVTRKANGAGIPIAAYDRVKKRIVLDGFGDEKINYGPMVAYDVVGHEYFHSILEANFPNLSSYSTKTWLNPIIEGTADFIGELIEGKNDGKWLFGEEVVAKDPKPFITNIAHPNENEDAEFFEGNYFVKFSNSGPTAASYFDPVSKQEVICEANTGFCNYESRNSTVWSHFLYMISEGGNFAGPVHIQGIGKRNAADIALGTLSRLAPDDDMRSACKKAIDAAELRVSTGQYPDFMVESIRKACKVANLGNYGEKRFYSPSKESGKDMGLSYSPAELTWEVFPEKENTWVVEVFNFPLVDSFAGDPEKIKYDIQTAVIGKEDIVKDENNARSLVSKTFELQPNSVYNWHICPITDDGSGYDPNVKPSPGMTLSDLNNCKDWRPVQTFATKEERASLKSPVDKIVATPNVLTFSWKGVKDTTSYEINVYENSGENTPGKLNSVFPFASEKVCDDKLECKYEVKWEDLLHKACWSVFSKKDEHSGIESEPKCWSVLPAKAKLSSPIGSIPFSADLVMLKWEKAEAATSYIANVCDRNPNGNTPACETFNTRIDAGSALSVEAPSIGTKQNGFCWQVISKNTWLSDEVASGFSCVAVDPEKPQILAPMSGTTIQPNASGEYLFSLEWQDASTSLHRLCVWPGDTPPASIGDNDACWGPLNNDPKKFEYSWKSKANPKLLYLQIATLAEDGKTFINRSDPVILYFKTAPDKPVIQAPLQGQVFKKVVGSAFEIPITWTGNAEAGYNVFLLKADTNFNVAVGGVSLRPPDTTGQSLTLAVPGENSNYKVFVASISKNNVYDAISETVYFSTGLLSTQDDPPPDPNAAPSCDLLKQVPAILCPGTSSYAFGVTQALCNAPFQFKPVEYPGDQSKIKYDLKICKSSGQTVGSECQVHSFSFSEFGAGSPITLDRNFEYAWQAQVRIEGCPGASPPSNWLFFTCGPTGNCPSNQ